MFKKNIKPVFFLCIWKLLLSPFFLLMQFTDLFVPVSVTLTRRSFELLQIREIHEH